MIAGPKNIVSQDQFNIQYLRKNLKIFCKSMAAYDKINKGLAETETPFYTYTKHQDKVKKMVFKD